MIMREMKNHVKKYFLVFVAFLLAIQTMSVSAYKVKAKDTITLEGRFFETSSTEYNNELAKFAALLSDKIEDRSGRDESGKEYFAKVFRETLMQYGFSSNNIVEQNLGSHKSAGFAIAWRDIYVNGKNTKLIVVTARGTKTLAEKIGDAWIAIDNIGSGRKENLAIHKNVADFRNKIYRKFKDLMFDKELHLLQNEDVKFLFTGHSLGGAAINALVGRLLLEGLEKDGEIINSINQNNIFCYTFGAIKTLIRERNELEGFENIHNIYGYYDSFGPNGHISELHVSSPWHKFGKVYLFKNPKRNESGYWLWKKSTNNHNMDTYREALNIENNITAPFPIYFSEKEVELSIGDVLAIDMKGTSHVLYSTVKSNDIDYIDLKNTPLGKNENPFYNEGLYRYTFEAKKTGRFRIDAFNYIDKRIKDTLYIKVVKKSKSKRKKITDVTKNFFNKRIKLYSDYYESPIRESDQDNSLSATYYDDRYPLLFDAKGTPDGWIGLRKLNGKWVSVRGNKSALKIEGDGLWEWECFKIYSDGNNYYLLAQKNGKLVRVTGGRDNPLYADQNKMSAETEFNIEITEEAFVDRKLKAPDFNYQEDDWGENPYGKENNKIHENTNLNIPQIETTTYVNQKFYYKTPYIRGYYTGEWKGNAPNGYGVLIYDDASANRSLGVIKHIGYFQNGVPHGYGSKEYVDHVRTGVFYGLYEVGKIVFDGDVVYHSGENKGRTFRGRLRATSSDNGEWTEDSSWIGEDNQASDDSSKNDSDSEESSWIDSSDRDSTERVEPEPLPKSKDKVSNQFYYKSDYIRGYYTGEWENNAPNGYGTLVYDSSSKNRSLGAIKYSGEFVDGLPYGQGTKYYKDHYRKGSWYGIYQAGKLIFDGEVVYTSGAYSGEVFVGKLYGISDNDGRWSEDSYWK